MSAATQAAGTGAVSGAAAGSVLGPWGTVAGGVIGGASGYLSGMGADKKAAAERAARRRLKEAVTRYGGQTEALNNSVTQDARGIDTQWMEALQRHLAGQPDLGAQLPGMVNTEQQALDAAGQPAFQPLGGQGGAEQAYARRVSADAQRRVHEGNAPLAFQAGAGRARLADQDYRNLLATKLAGLNMQAGRLGRLQGLQQQLNYEPVANAQARYGTDRARAATAGSSEALAGGLTQAGGNLLAGAFMGKNAARNGGASG